MLLYGSRTLSVYALLTHAMDGFLPEIKRGKYGKPFFPERPDCQFSLSHSGAFSLCALSDRPVGVDIEVVRPRKENLPQYALTEKEYTAWNKMGATWDAFYELWTKKEAWGKYTGLGLPDALQQDIPPGLRWGYYAGDSWRASLCGETAPPESITWIEKTTEVI